MNDASFQPNPCPVDLDEAWQIKAEFNKGSGVKKGERLFNATQERWITLNADLPGFIGWCKRAPFLNDEAANWPLERAPANTVLPGDVFYSERRSCWVSTPTESNAYAWISRCPRKDEAPPPDSDKVWEPVSARLVPIQDVETGDRFFLPVMKYWKQMDASYSAGIPVDTLVWTKRVKNCVLYYHYQAKVAPADYDEVWRDVPISFCNAVIGHGERFFDGMHWHVCSQTTETKILGWAKRAPDHWSFDVVNGWLLERAPLSTVQQGDHYYHHGNGWIIRRTIGALTGYGWIYRNPVEKSETPLKTVDQATTDPAVLPGMVSLLELCKRELAKGTDPRDVLGGFEGQRAVTLRPGVSVTEEYFQSVVKAERDRRLHVEQFNCVHGKHAAHGCPVCSAFTDQMEKRSDAWIPK
jgi:hypothetical protein